MPVEDASREDHVIGSVAKAGQSRGLDPTSVSNFLRAQIEANKLLQYSLLAEWRREGRAPDQMPVDLASSIRLELDEVDKALIAELEESYESRIQQLQGHSLIATARILGISTSSVKARVFHARVAPIECHFCKSAGRSVLANAGSDDLRRTI